LTKELSKTFCQFNNIFSQLQDFAKIIRELKLKREIKFNG